MAKMVKYQVSGPDGKVYEIEGPEDATAAEIESAARDLLAPEPKARQEPKVGTRAPLPGRGGGGGLSRQAVSAAIGAPPKQAPSPVDGMSGVDTYRAGLGKVMSDAWLGARGLVQDTSEDVREMRRLDAPLMDTTGGQLGNLTGQVGAVLGPGAVVKGLGIAANAAGATGAARGLSVAGDALLAPRGVWAGGAQGAAAGAIQPAEDWTERGGNMAGGTVGGVAVPAAGLTYRATRAGLDPFYQEGRERIVGNVMRNAAGGDDAARAAAARIEAGQQPLHGPFQGAPRETVGEMVPGSYPTTAQLADNPGIGALDLATTGISPTQKMAARDTVEAQMAARRAELGDMAGTKEQRQFYRTERDATANQLYDASFAAPMDQAAVQRLQPEFARLSENPHIQNVVAAARELARGAGIKNFDAGTVQGMHYLKLALDDAIASGGAGGTSYGRTKLAQMTQAKHDLTAAIEAVSPDYRAARQTFIDQSRPINQMDTAEMIREQAVDKVTGNVNPRPIANAVEGDRTAQRATGFRGATMDDTFDDATRNRLQMLLDDARRAERTTRQAKGIGSPTVQNLAYANMVEQSGIPTWLTNVPILGAGMRMAGGIGSRVADAAYGRANNQLQQLLTDALQDPAQVAALLRRSAGGGAPYSANGLLELLRRGATPAFMAVPGSVNANQQQPLE